MTAEDGVTPHSGNQMLGGAAPGALATNWCNIAYRVGGGQNFASDCMLDWWFYDPLGNAPNAADFEDYVALCMVARQAATHQPEALEQAAKWADLFIAKFQKADGAYSHGKNSYGALTLGSEFLSQLVWFERPLAATDARWKERYDRHANSIARSVANLEKVKDLGATEGEQTYEDSQAGSAWSLLALHALMAADSAHRDEYLAESVAIQGRHECLTQALIPDGRMRGGTLRWWEAQYNVLTTGPNMLNSPHAWTMRSQFGALYLYLLTGQERYLDLAYNAMGACAQAIDLKSGTLRWAFVPDPYVKLGQFVPDPATPDQGKHVPAIIGEQWLPMISDWWQVPPGRASGWTLSSVMEFSSGRPYAGLLSPACTSSTLSFSNCNGADDNLNDTAFNQDTANTAGGIMAAARRRGSA